MAEPRVRAGGGWPAVGYTVRKALSAGNPLDFYRRMRSRNACKTCALGMGGQAGGMVNETGRFPEVCKKSVQAQAADLQGSISVRTLDSLPFRRLETLRSAELERLGRIGFPLIADEGDEGFRRIHWEGALDRAAEAFRGTRPEEVFFYSSGRSSNEAAFLMQLMARAYGTQNIHNCSFYCHQASSVGLAQVYGSGTGSVVLEDLEKADLVLVAGANPASNHPRLISQLVGVRRRGGRVLIVNPLRELGLTRFRIPSDWRSLLFGSTVSDLYLQPHAGSDVALFKALLKGILESGGLDQDYIRRFTTGWSETRVDLEATQWNDLLGACGVAREEVDAAVRMLVRAKRGVLCWAMGLTHHANGVDNVLALSNLALARGWLGRPGTGLLPIRGHSNVQGVGSVGVAPVLKRAFERKLGELYGIAPAAEAGMDTFRSLEAAAAGRIRAAFLLGGNLFGSNPDREWAARSLRRIPTSVFVSTKLNEGHVHGRGRRTLILPALARDEETQATTQESMFSFVRLSQGGQRAASAEMRSEVDIIASLARRILPEGRFDWTALGSHRALRAAIAAAVPGYEPIAGMDGRSGKFRGEFHVGGRTFHEPRFPTSDGRARFRVTPLPAFGVQDGEFRLLTLRSEGQFNTVVYEEEDLYRGNARRDVVMMSAADANALGLDEGDRVRVISDAGALEVGVAIVDIRSGNLAMYYPEANALVPRRLDPRSGTPAFKSVRARIRPVPAATRSARVARRFLARHPAGSERPQPVGLRASEGSARGVSARS